MVSAPPRTPGPPSRSETRPHWTVGRRFEGDRSAEALVRSLLAAHIR